MARLSLSLALMVSIFFTDAPAFARDVTLFVTSCAHLYASDHRSSKCIVQALNGVPGWAYPLTFGTIDVPRGVIMAGDLTNWGTQNEWNWWLSYFGLAGVDGQLNYPMYEGRGNHDVEHEVEPVYNGVTARHGNVLYAWDWDDVHFVCCDNEVDLTVSAWLADHLAGIAPHTPVILYHHIDLPGRHTAEEQDAYEQAIQGHNVIGIFHGHTHVECHYTWRGYDVYNAPSPMSVPSAFYVVWLRDTGMLVAEYEYTRDGDHNWTGGSWGSYYTKTIAPPAVCLSVSEIDGRLGDVALDPAPFDANLPEFPVGTLVQLTATPADGWRFDEWSGDVPDANRTDNPLALKMSRDRSVAASFVEAPRHIFNLTVQADGHGVTMPGSGPYTAGTIVRLYAKPMQGWVFDKWEGDVPADKQTRNPVALAMDQDRALTCCFKESTEDESAAGACFLTPLAVIALIPLGSVLILATPRRRIPRGQAARHAI